MYMDKVYFMGPDKGGDRAFTLVGGARQAIPRHDPAAGPGARDGAAALRQRSALDRGGANPEGRRQKGGARHGGPAHRPGGDREVRAPEVRGHGQDPNPGADSAE